jgi:hypothetical protein
MSNRLVESALKDCSRSGFIAAGSFRKENMRFDENRYAKNYLTVFSRIIYAWMGYHSRPFSWYNSRRVADEEPALP